jgi:hypothetical protein
LDPAEDVVVVVLTTFFVVFEFLPPFFDIDDDDKEKEFKAPGSAAFEDKVVNILMSYFCRLKDDVMSLMFVVVVSLSVYDGCMRCCCVAFVI